MNFRREPDAEPFVRPDEPPWYPPDAPPRPPAPARVAVLNRLRQMAARIDERDVLIVAGILLLARGCYLVAPPLGYLVPGAILVWQHLPQRDRFLKPKPPAIIIPPGPKGV